MHSIFPDLSMLRCAQAAHSCTIVCVDLLLLCCRLKLQLPSEGGTSRDEVEMSTFSGDIQILDTLVCAENGVDVVEVSSLSSLFHAPC